MVDFSQYTSCLQQDDAEHREMLESCYQEAARVMSPGGLDNYLEGIRALCSMGKSRDLVLTYVAEMPGVAREVGEDVVPDIVTQSMKLASHTSGSVITLLYTSLPMVAQRLGDADLVRGYLGLIYQLAGKAPRGLRPMLENMDELLQKLTLGGLRRWALWGTQAHQRDLQGQMDYFGLKTEASRAVLKRERRGTLFVDNHRKLNFYMRALWGRSFFMRPTSGDYESRQGLRPYIEDFQLHLPDAFDGFNGINGIDCYRAAVAHMTSHLVYTREPLSAEQLGPAQIKMVELFEDARVELKAIAEFPGLKKLWLRFFAPTQALASESGEIHPAVDMMMRMAHCLLDDTLVDRDGQLNHMAAEFRVHFSRDPDNPRISWMAGIGFYHYLAKTLAIPALRVLETMPLTYRDDNRYLWKFDPASCLELETGYLPANQKQVRRYVSTLEMAQEIDCELAGDDAQEVWVLDAPFYLDQEACTINELEGKEPVSDPFHYQEWDYQVQLFRPDWVTVVERRQVKGNPEVMDDILEHNRPVASRIRHLIDALQPKGIVRRRGYEEGEELDLNAAVRAMTDIRRGIMPDPRISIRITRHVRDLAVVILLDLSESTTDPIDGDEPEGATILDLTREATGLLSWAIDSIGDPFAVHGFASDGRHDVQYYRFKDFDQAYDDIAKSRLAGMQGGLSTRMGAALRHAGWHLTQQNCQRRLVLLVTDGEPADIDERDPQYLRHDAKRAVDDLAATGVNTYCLTLDPGADSYVKRIFGANNYSIVDNVGRLPERLPAVFAALTG